MQERPRTIHGMIHTKWPGCEYLWRWREMVLVPCFRERGTRGPQSRVPEGHAHGPTDG